jgi:probable rRNA maturation factor
MPVLVRNGLRRVSFVAPRIHRLAQDVLQAAGVPGSEVSLLLVGDSRMRRLNRRYRGRDASTDVLAFALREAGGPASSLLGDVVISLPQAARQAKAGGRSLSEELMTLLIHGVLHLVGYDHERSEREARRMRRKEQAVRRALASLPVLIRIRPVISRSGCAVDRLPEKRRH